MSAPVLVATPHVAFGELLRVSLEDSGPYRVTLVQTAQAARAQFSAPKDSFALAIFDSALNDQPFISLCMDLIERQPGVRLIVIPPENNPNHPSLGGLLPHGYLSRPFYLPDLLDTVTRLLADRDQQAKDRLASQPPVSRPITGENKPAAAGAPAAGASPTIPLWLIEPHSLRDYLAAELVKTQALAAIVGIQGSEPGTGVVQGSAIRDVGATNSGGATHSGGAIHNGGAIAYGDEPGASPSRFPEEAADELAAVVFRYWNNSEKTDLMRYIRLASSRKDYLVYATQITGDVVLILVYDSAAPVSQIRPQTKSMAQALATLPPENYDPQRGAGEVPPTGSDAAAQPVEEDQATAAVSPSAEAEDLAAPGQPETDTQPPADTPPGAADTGWFAEDADHLPAKPVEPTPPPSESDDEDEGGPVINLAALIGAIPPPNPDENPLREGLSGSGWSPERFANREVPTRAGPEREISADAWRAAGENGSAMIYNAAAHPVKTEPLDNPPQSAPDSAPETTPALPVDYALPAAAPHERVETPPTAEPPADAQPAQSIPAELEETPAGAAPADEEKINALPESGPTAEAEAASSEGAAEADAPDAAAEAAALAEAEAAAAVTRAMIPPGRSAAGDIKTEPPIAPPGLPIEPRPVPIPDAEFALQTEPPNGLEDTRQSLITAVTHLEQLEPVSPALSLLNYTCVLVPRLPQHYLTGELADRLALWVQQLCMAFGWRLEGIAIRPEYLQWIVQVAPSVSPGNLVRIIRQRTSFHIFNAFPHLADQNPSGDFWAIGYLIVSGSQPPSAQLLRDYIAQTRKRQGINK